MNFYSEYGMMAVHQCFFINFRHGTGIAHTNPNHGLLSDKSDPCPFSIFWLRPFTVWESGYARIRPSTKHIRLYHLVSQNAFSASDKHGCLQWAIIFGGELSRDYLVASDERVHLQCDIVLRGDPGLPRVARRRVYINYHY